MIYRLIVVRHAKSSWSDPFSDDHARVLNKRGIVSAKAVGAWLMREGYVPDLCLSSDATRAQETARLMLPELDPTPPLELSGKLYHAAPDTILDVIRNQTAPALAIFGHNPGIGMAASMLVTQPPAHNRFSDYPTCATTVIDFHAGSWREVQPRQGKCQAFTVPRDLIGASGFDIE